jgi:hypothetical protein
VYLWLDLYAPYLAVGAAAVALAALIWAILAWRRLQAVQQRYAELTVGTSGGNLEAVLNTHLENVQAALLEASQARQTVQEMEERARSHVQHVAVIRYNPFDHTGGDQSFVLALADAQGDGVVINSLHARDGTRIYAKPVTGWHSVHALTDEEQNAIARAKEGGQDEGS